MKIRIRTRLSESIDIGPIRGRLSEPLFGRGRVWQSVTVGRGMFSVRESGPVGGKRGRRGKRRGRR